MKTLLVSLGMLALLASDAVGFPEIQGRHYQIDTLSKNFTLLDGIQGNDTLPDDLRMILKPVGSPLKDWEILLRDRINHSRLTLADGRLITTYSYFKTDKEGKQGVIVGSVSPVNSIDISLVSEIKKGTEIQAMFNDPQAQVMEPLAKDIGVFNFQLEPQNFRPRMSSASIARNLIFVLIDKSGSMAASMDGVEKSGRLFLLKLPKKKTECMLAAFNHQFHLLGNSYWHGTCRDKARLLKGILPEGGTNIYSALLIAFQAINSRRDAIGKNVKPLLLVVTDGAQNDTVSIPKSEVIKAMEKSGTTVFTFWQGTGLDKKPLEGITAFEMDNTQDIEKGLKTFFSNVNLYTAGQMHLLIPKQGIKVAGKNP